MLTGKEPRQYLIRTWMDGQGSVEWTIWAHSSEDAKFQVDLELKQASWIKGCVIYVGPINPDCQCLNECRCGGLSDQNRKKKDEPV